MKEIAVEEILAIYQRYLKEVTPDSMAHDAYAIIVEVLQGSTDVLYIKNVLHSTELSMATSEMKAIFQAARYRVERVIWP